MILFDFKKHQVNGKYLYDQYFMVKNLAVFTQIIILLFNQYNQIKNGIQCPIVDKDLRCQICMCLVLDPVECIECQHDFCQQCIEQTQQKCPYKCPDAEFQQSHRRTRGILSNLILRCPNYQRGCLHGIKMEQINSHLKDECQYMLYQCNNKGCVAFIYDYIKEEHNKQCKYKVSKCVDCQQLYKQFDKHECLTDAVNSLKKKQLIIKRQQKQINQLKAQVNEFEEIKRNQQVMSKYKCKKFHKLKWLIYQQPRTCALCQTVKYSCYSCQICDERYCIACKPPHLNRDKCIEGHQLRYHQNKQATCLFCNNHFVGIYFDEQCKIYTCTICYQRFQ
ncbi:hypothetical protein pb186bvf_010528 [Paramecium bursaria]